MNHRDVLLVGLFALAYLYLDASTPSPRRSLPILSASPPPTDEEHSAPAFAPASADLCPRDPAHGVSLRGDGAKWCRACDEAFYPVALVI